MYENDTEIERMTRHRNKNASTYLTLEYNRSAKTGPRWLPP